MRKKKKNPSHTGTLKNRFSYLDPGDIRDTGLIPGLERSPGGGHGNPLQYLFLQRIPRAESLGGLQSIGSKRVGHN